MFNLFMPLSTDFCDWGSAIWAAFVFGHPEIEAFSVEPMLAVGHDIHMAQQAYRANIMAEGRSLGLVFDCRERNNPTYNILRAHGGT